MLLYGNTKLFAFRSLQVKPVEKEVKDQASDCIDLPEKYEKAVPNSIARQCSILGAQYFKESTGMLTEFSSTYTVELSSSASNEKTVLFFNQSTQVSHKDEQMMDKSKQKDQVFRKTTSTTTTFDRAEKSGTLRTYSKKEPVVEVKKALSLPLTSPVSAATSVCFQGYQTVANTNALHDLTAVETADFNLLLVCLENFHPRKAKVEDMLLMFLMKIRHDLPFTALAALFGTDDKSISRYFYLILDHLSVQ